MHVLAFTADREAIWAELGYALDEDEIGRKVVYRDVEHNGAARAAARIAELI